MRSSTFAVRALHNFSTQRGNMLKSSCEKDGLILTVNATVGTVGTATHAWGTVAHGVLDDQGVDVETLGVSVGFGVLQQTNDELAALLWPPTLGHTEGFALCVTSDIALVATVWDDFLLLDNGFKVCECTAEVHATDGTNGFACVFVVHTEVGAPSFACCKVSHKIQPWHG